MTDSFLRQLVHSVNNYWTLISQGSIWRCDNIRKGWCGCPLPHGRYYRSATSRLPTELLQSPLPLPPITTPRPISWKSHHSVPEPLQADTVCTPSQRPPGHAWSQSHVYYLSWLQRPRPWRACTSQEEGARRTWGWGPGWGMWGGSRKQEFVWRNCQRNWLQD